MTTPHRTSSFSFRLDTEWDHLRTARRSLRHARRWASDDADDRLTTLARGITDLDELITATQRGAAPTGSDDALLLRLVELARDDELAGRVVIQRLLPGLISRAVRFRDYHDDIDPIEVVVPAAWLAVRTFDTERRRHHVAASLISDAVYQAFRQPLRRRSSAEVTTSPYRFRGLPSDDLPTPVVELAEVIRDARSAGVSAYDIDLLCHIARTESPAIVAQDRNVTDRTIRKHRRRAVNHVRAAIAA